MSCSGPLNAAAGILYFLQGDKHAARLVVSLVSLRRHYNGPVAVAVTNEPAMDIAQRLESDEHLAVRIVDCQGAVPSVRNASYAFKANLPEVTPFDNTVYIDCDTMIRNPLDELFRFATPAHTNLTQFTAWSSSGRIVRQRIERWNDLCPELIDPAISFGPAINTGIFAFTRHSAVLPQWRELTHRGRRKFIPDEVAMQLLAPHYPSTIFPGQFNCSPTYGNPASPETVIIHFHGRRHLRAEKGGRHIWLPEFREALKQNVAGIAEWAPASDQQLAEILRTDSHFAEEHEN